MKSIRLKLKNPTGLHVRPASLLVNEARKFQSRITVQKGNKTVDCKGIMGVIMLEAQRNDVIEITASGPDEEAAVRVIKTLVNNGLGV
jgi:phosphotransferase system HPr (HPr) family protein